MSLRQDLPQLPSPIHACQEQAQWKGNFKITQAPGDIKKPNLPPKKRGRPPIHREINTPQSNCEKLDESESCVIISKEEGCSSERIVSDADYLSALATLLKTLPK
jgi:hypothetical protein